MAQSYQLIGTVTVGSGGAANIEFTNIPQNYTDLKVVTSLRAGASTGIKISFNSTTSGYTMRSVYGIGSGTPTSDNNVISDAIFSNSMVNDTSFTASSFANGEVYIPNYTSSNNKSVSIDAVTETNATTSLQQLVAGLWSNSAAISSINLVPSAGNFPQHTTAYLYGIGGSRASGGTITADANYTYHTFTSTGTFTALERIRGAEALVIAGGGGGGYAGGGGGAGGFRVVPGLLLPAGNTYAVTVGAGGTGGTGSGGVTSSQTTSGSNSVFSNIISTGGGKGSSYDATTGGNGGSGGGGGGGSSGNGGTGNGGSYSPVEGYAGGNGVTSNGGGGGGAGAVGTAGINDFAGAGGIGSSAAHSWGYATSTGENVGNTYYYAGGGGGRGLNGGAGGSGGGGAGCSGSSNSGVAGTANTGGGGGSGGNSPATGGNGGSGVVIIRYPNS